MERRLAAIVVADVVGYSRLMAEDEAGTLTALRTLHKELIEPKAAQRRGRVVKLKGDGALLEFGSAVDAVAFAVEVQRAMREQGAVVPAHERIELRIGINVGDILIEADDIYGDGVNVAARLEALADPGGIAVTGAVREYLDKKLDLHFEDLGDQRLKNIPRSVRVHRVRLDAPKSSHSRPISESELGLSKPVIAVLPFENLSGSERWDRFSTGMTDDIITDIARYRDISVIARNSTFAYRGKSVDVRQIGRDLQANYVLEGSIQTAGRRLRVTAQLIDAHDGNHIWAERYDRSASDLFAIQDDVIVQVATALGGFHGEILRAERGKVRRRRPESLRAYEQYLIGYELEAKLEKESTLEAIRVLESAIEKDPFHAQTWTVLGWACGNAAAAGWSQDAAAAAARRRAAVMRAADLDPRDPIALEELGALQAQEGDISGARETLERALDFGRNHADALALLAKYVSTVLGRENEALDIMKRAFRLNPHAPNWYYMNLLRVAYFARDFETAADVAKRSADIQVTHLFNTISLAQLGRSEEASIAVTQFRRSYPDFRPESVIKSFPLIHPPAIDLYKEGLRKAGMFERDISRPTEADSAPVPTD